ncbi:hypothetical protein QYM36_011736 [Artemia franciscana]|uniref:Uncharacterized protein n=1 Tax=Artemia franciscana TaxID=6661 RepID=A0AA88HJQ4_ARTSF|nr:hypothetical protein QYM36_011736 [Artemia franciscana]
MKPIIFFVAVAIVATRADIFLDSSMNSNPEEVWLLQETEHLSRVRTITTKVIGTSLCYSVIPTDVFAVIQAFTPTTFQLNVAIATLEDPGNCRKKRWAFENAVDGRLSGPNEALKIADDANPR